jgi:hypothetical protein
MRKFECATTQETFKGEESKCAKTRGVAKIGEENMRICVLDFPIVPMTCTVHCAFEVYISCVSGVTFRHNC